MRVLKFVILSICSFSSCWVEANDVTFDLDRITTENGRIYQNILILDSDQYGLLFRHAKGIAKINFEQLSMNLRMLYEPVEEMPMESTVSDATGLPLSELSSFDKGATLLLTARTSAILPLHCYSGVYSSRCPDYRRVWPRHWSRYHPGLRLGIPECRARAVDDFLITTGLVPRPPGVVTYQLPYNRPYLLY